MEVSSSIERKRSMRRETTTRLIDGEKIRGLFLATLDNEPNSILNTVRDNLF